MWTWCMAALATPVEAQTPAPEPSAQEPASDGSVETYSIPTLTSDLPSALQTGRLEAGEDDGSLMAALAQYGIDGDDFARPRLVRGGWFVRPRLAVSQLFAPSSGPIGVRMGLSAGRRFWTIEALPVQLAADLGLRATAPVGGASGRRVEGFANVGPWLGPARIQVGLGARWEQEFWHHDTVELVDAVHLGPAVQVAFDAGFLQANVGLMPSWKVWGDRSPASATPTVFPVLAHETTWSAGLAAPLGPLRLGADVAWRDTAVGGLLEVGLILGIDITAFRSKSKEANEEDP